MRVWLQKQKKKDEAKAASQAPPTPVETTPAAPEVQPVGDAADKPVESVEETPAAEAASGDQVAEDKSGDADHRTGSAVVQTNEVGFISTPISSSRAHEHGSHNQSWRASFVCLARINLVVAACASEQNELSSMYAKTNDFQESIAPPDEGIERRGSTASQLANKSIEPSASDAATGGPANTGESNAAMVANNPMMMSGQMLYGGFNNGMGFPMNGMSNMMGNSNWNGMNSMGKTIPILITRSIC